MKKAPQKRKLSTKTRNYHFWLPEEIADKFDDLARKEDRSKASLFRRILEKEFMEVQ